jgi:hypothetical protein
MALISQPSYNFLASFSIEKDQIFGVVTVCWEIFVQLHAVRLIFHRTNSGSSSSESCAQRLRLVISIARIQVDNRFVGENIAKTERKD